MGEQDIESAVLQEPLVQQAREDLETPYYPDEKLVLGLPAMRTFVTLFWGYNVAWGGGGFILDYVCTTGLRATFWSAIVTSTIFTLYSTYSLDPLPLTYTFAKGNGLNAFWCATYTLYQGALVAIAMFIITFATLSCFVPVEDFWNWNCSFRD
mmetsp:Transcript_3097/g.4505  ORF Transcript_3097/g.4505 Transcript_3097/m.4505 type:complete len:153 (-) Transcript_3097:145-603(-)